MAAFDQTQGWEATIVICQHTAELSIFRRQVVSLDQWPLDMYKGLSTSWQTGTLWYFVLLTAVSSTVTINFMLAVLSIAFQAERCACNGFAVQCTFIFHSVCHVPGCNVL